MYESDRGLGLGLEPETLERMREVFGGQTCLRCGAPAERVSVGRFYCGEHFPTRKKDPPRLPKVYRCTVGMSD